MGGGIKMARRNPPNTPSGGAPNGGNQNPKPPNRQPKNSKVDVIVKAETTEARKSIAELERKLLKLTEIGNQGAYRQNGLLSPKQVELYKNLIKEVERIQTQFNAKLQQATDVRVKKQSELDEARINGASPATIKALEQQVKEAEAREKVLEQSGKTVNSTRDKAIEAGDRISNDLRESNPAIRDLLLASKNFLQSAGVILSVGQVVRYVTQGYETAKVQSDEAYKVAQKMDIYGSDYRGSVRLAQNEQSLNLGYTGLEGLAMQRALIAGGSTAETFGRQNQPKDQQQREQQMASNIANDIVSAQRFSRAYGIQDPSELIRSATVLKKLGGIEDGQLSKFANIISGQISKVGGKGREEEIVRATTDLVSKITSALPTKLSETRVEEINSMLTMLGRAVPGLVGERGAQVLGGLDQSFKDQDIRTMTIMGLGSKYKDLGGVLELQKKMEQGLTGSNLQEFFQGMKKFGFTNNTDVMRSVLKDTLFKNTEAPLTTIDELMKSGALTKLAQGGLSPEEANRILKEGMDKIATNLGKYQESEVGKRKEADARLDKTKSDVGAAVLPLVTEIKNLFSNLPESVQMGATLGGTLLAGQAVKSLWNKGATWWNSRGIQGTGALSAEVAEEMATGSGTAGRNSGGSGTGSGGGGLFGWGSNNRSPRTPNAPRSRPKFSTRMKGAGIAGLIMTGTNIVENISSGESVGRSIAEGIGSIVGMLGLGALGSLLGPVGSVAGGAAGSYLGAKAGGAIYDFFAGDDKKSASNMEGTQTQVMQATDEQGQPVAIQMPDKIEKVTVTNFELADGRFEELLAGMVRAQDKKSEFSGSTGGTINHEINVRISGDVKGMNKESNDVIADAVSESLKIYFSKNNYDLSKDTRRLVG